MKQMTSLIRMAVILGVATSSASRLFAQAPGVPIEQNENRAQNPDILAQAKALKEAGKLMMNIERAKEQLKTPVPVAVKFPKARRHEMSGREIAQAARAGHLRFGWFCLCSHCNNWHVNLAGAYAVAKNVIATCYHCVDPNANMREGYLVAVDHTGKVIPVIAVLARNQAFDGAILLVEGGTYEPLPFSDNVAPGDAAYCFSSPLGQSDYFSAGIVNRFIWSGPAGKAGTVEEWENLRLNVSTDWAPGSSGSAVLDQSGNVIGHVSTIQPMTEGPARTSAKSTDTKDDKTVTDRFGGATLITLHFASPARAMLALAAGLSDVKSSDTKVIPKPIQQEAHGPVEKLLQSSDGSSSKHLSPVG